MRFDINEYMRLVVKPETRCIAEQSLEFAIERLPLEKAFELHKYRTPARVALMELKNLKKAGFPEDKRTPDSEFEIVVRTFIAAWEHAKKYWPDQVEKYDMSNYRLSEDAA